jgi:hypothetical protein
MTRRTMLGLAAALVAVITLGLAPAARGDLLLQLPFDQDANPGDTVSDVSGSPSVQVGTLEGNAFVSGGAMHLDGSGDYLKFGDESELESLGAMTLSARVNAASPIGGSYRRIVEHEDVFYFWADSGSFRYTTHGSSSQAVSSTAPAVGTWQEVTAVYRAGQPAEIYVDGVLEDTSGNQGAMNNSTHPLQVGARRGSGGSPSNFWDGDMDDVLIFDQALSQGQVAELAGAPAHGLLIHSTMDDADVNRGGTNPPPPLSTTGGNWTVEDLAGTAEDGNANSVNAGGTVDSSVAGIIDQAISFSSGKGGNRRVDYGDVHDITPSDSQTISLWFKSESAGDTDYIAAKGNFNSGTNGWAIGESSEGGGRLQLRAEYSGSDNGTQNLGLYIPFTSADEDTWHHVAFVIDNSAGKIFGYLDGLGSGTWGTDNGWSVGGWGGDTFTFAPGRDFDTDHHLVLGADARDPAGNEWDGDMDDFALWDAALTPSKAAALYNFGLSGLHYNAATVNQVFEAFDNGVGTLTIGGQTWHYATDLPGSPGDVHDFGSNLYAVVLDPLGNGYYSVPEPGTLTLLAFGGMGLLARRRRQRKARG